MGDRRPKDDHPSALGGRGDCGSGWVGIVELFGIGPGEQAPAALDGTLCEITSPSTEASTDSPHPTAAPMDASP